MLRKYFIILLIWLLMPSLVFSKEKKYEFSNIEIEDGKVIFDFEIKNLFTEDVINGLRKGMTAALEYKIQLWQKKFFWVNKIDYEKILRYKINYNIWEKRYAVYTGMEKPKFLNIDRVKKLCCEIENYSLCRIKDLNQNNEYIIIIKVTFRPMSIDNYEEIRRWVSREAKEFNPKELKKPRKAGEKAGNWLVEIVLNLTGFGDRVITAKSEVFSCIRDSIIIQGSN